MPQNCVVPPAESRRTGEDGGEGLTFLISRAPGCRDTARSCSTCCQEGSAHPNPCWQTSARPAPRMLLRHSPAGRPSQPLSPLCSCQSHASLATFNRDLFVTACGHEEEYTAFIKRAKEYIVLIQFSGHLYNSHCCLEASCLLALQEALFQQRLKIPRSHTESGGDVAAKPPQRELPRCERCCEQRGSSSSQH